MVKKYKPKQLRFKHVCEICNEYYKSADVKGRFCKMCKKPRECRCGCGKVVKTPGHFFARGCKIRGRTYQDIYGTENPGCGFKRGSLNPMSDPILVKKALSNINKGIEYKGFWFRSTYEKEVYQALELEGYRVEYERHITLSKKNFVPDFIVNDEVVVEVSGYGSAFSRSRRRNINKIEKLIKRFKYLIFIVDGYFMEDYKERFCDEGKVLLIDYKKFLNDKSELCKPLAKKVTLIRATES